MKITLDANPSDAPCCLKIEAEDGRDVLIQTDWDWPSVASSFGFSLRSIQRCPECKGLCNVPDGNKRFGCHNCADLVTEGCHHSGTDGTIDCPECGITAHQFIQEARQWMRDNDGAQAEDPGYFDN